jgi:hypothetical protein
MAAKYPISGLFLKLLKLNSFTISLAGTGLERQPLHPSLAAK